MASAVVPLIVKGGRSAMSDVAGLDLLPQTVNTRPQGRLGQRRARTRVIEPRNLNRFFDELIAKVGGSNPSGCAM